MVLLGESGRDGGQFNRNLPSCPGTAVSGATTSGEADTGGHSDFTVHRGNGHPRCTTTRERVEVSTEKGQGEDSMMSFVQAHFGGILKPFADHVNELQRCVSRIDSDVQQMAVQVQHNNSVLDEQTGVLESLQAELRRTATTSKTLTRRVEELSTETSELADNHKNMRAGLDEIDGRLCTSEENVAEVQSNLKSTRGALGKWRDALGKLERDVAARICPIMDKLAMDLKHLDALHRATADSLSETRSFSETFNQAFQVYEQESEQRQMGHDRKFDHVDDQFAELGRTMKDMRDRDQLHEEHLSRVESVVAPVKHRLDLLEAVRDDHRRRYNDIEKTLTGLQVCCNGMGVDIAKLIEFYEQARQQDGEDLFGALQSMKRVAAQNADNIRGLSDSITSHTDAMKKSDARTSSLEQSHAALQMQSSKLAERVGLSTPAPSRSPSREAPPAPHLQVPATRERVPWAVLRAVDKMSLATRQRRATQQISEMSSDLTSVSSTLSRAASKLDDHEMRVSQLESQVIAASEDLKHISSSMELNQEYWKGLGKALRETHRSVNVEGEVLPPLVAHKKLPVIRGPSLGPGGPACTTPAQ